jgi:hypothetical protein
VKAIPAPEFEHSPACERYGRTVELDLEVSPGLQLLRVTGLPPDATDKLQWEPMLHFIRTSQLVDVPDIQVFIIAEATFSAELIGYIRLPDACPSLPFHRENSCIPVPLSIAIPMSGSPISWKLTARLQTPIGVLCGLSLGTVRIG